MKLLTRIHDIFIFHRSILQDFSRSPTVIIPNHNQANQHKKTRKPLLVAGFVLLWTSLYYQMVPKAGLEPARVSPHAPQACASTNSTTSANLYFLLCCFLCTSFRFTAGYSRRILDRFLFNQGLSCLNLGRLSDGHTAHHRRFSRLG